MARPTLQIVIGSTRPGRLGLPIGRWLAGVAEAHGGFEVEVVDLAEVDLPFLDEPGHPRLGGYEHEHTRRWSQVVQRGDAYVFVTPEYNHGYSAVLKNAIDFLHREWHHKPVAFVSYGGVSAGTRAAQALKQVAIAVKLVPLYEGVPIPFAHQVVGADGTVRPTDPMQAGAKAMLDELATMAAKLAR